MRARQASRPAPPIRLTSRAVLAAGARRLSSDLFSTTEDVMKTLYAAMIAAGLMLGVGTAVARDTSTNSSAGQDAATQAKQNPGSEADERRDRDSTQQGKTVPGPGAGKHPSDSATTGGVVKSQESTGTANTGKAGDPTDELRNRDSSKQQDPNSPPKQ